MYYYRARYYSADLGRFISRDPIGMRDDINLYSYVGNNPVKYVDPMGLEKSLIILTIDKDGLIPTFDQYGYALNYENSYVASIYNSVISGNPNKKYDVRLIYNFSDFDKIINEKQRNEIIFIGHGSQNNISLNGGSIITPPNSNTYLNLNNQVLATDVQTSAQSNRLANTDLYLLSCNTGNTIFNSNPIAKQIEDHYGFKATYAPSAFIYGGGDISFNLLGIKISGQFNEFTK